MPTICRVRGPTTSLPDTGSPLGLPHLEIGDGGAAAFLGEPVPADLWSGPADLELWRRCDGTVPLGVLSDGERQRVTAWHNTGMVTVVDAVASVRTGTEPITVVSPHPDDATLALGALLATRGGTVVDVFTYETFTRRGYYRERAELTARLLCEEEAVACRVLGVEYMLLGHHDAVLRPAWAGGFLDTGSGNPAAPAKIEPDVYADVTADLRDCLPTDGLVFTPLGVGGHADHLLARDATIAAFDVRGWSLARLAFYEDMPYSLFGDPTAAGPSGRRLEPTLLPAGESAAWLKREALRAYRIQVAIGLADRVVRYGRRPLGRPAAPKHGFAERVWTFADELPAPKIE
jgi:LmbE family N-acetylglucosaminyl deacetylase